MGPNFTQCAQLFLGNKTLSDQYGWKGRVWYVNANASTQISLEGCLTLCGEGADYYPWAQIASTITTWILPIIGIILQASFESNQLWATVGALARWIGSPIASLSYIIWNINVSAKCALMVDMSWPISEGIPDVDSDYSDMRDSLYILSAMNQFSMKPIVITTLKREAEGLLRIALFSKDLRLRTSDKRLEELQREIIHSRELRLRTSDKTLSDLRREIAYKLREHRKRGVVPVFISIMWFIFSLGISIQSSFGLLGNNTTAHDLATGLLMSWLPVLILASIVDRNFNSSEMVREKLNLLINRVCESLEYSQRPDIAQTNEETRRHYIDTFRDAPQLKRQKMEDWVCEISAKCGDMTDFFVRFAGQGRERWHYGAAHPILTSIEKNYIAQRRRPWLANEKEARLELVLGDPGEGLIWFDWREIWQVFAACAIVFCSVAGAFLLSFSTPTVGLGCRSGYFMIFALNSFVLAILEFVMWATSIPTDFHKAMGSRLKRQSVIVKSFSVSALERIKSMVLTSATFLLRICGFGTNHRTRMTSQIDHVFIIIKSWGAHQWADRCFFRPLEAINLLWLAYVVMGQAVGSYQTCYCQSSSWSAMGGYIDFTQYALSDIHLLRIAWPIATAVSTSAMGISMVLVVREWCLQSHLSTQDYDNARSGLRKTRYYRWLEYFLPIPVIYRLCAKIWASLVSTAIWLLRLIGVTCDLSNIRPKAQKSLKWQWHDEPLTGTDPNTYGGASDDHSEPGDAPSGQLAINILQVHKGQELQDFRFPSVPGQRDPPRPSLTPTADESIGAPLLPPQAIIRRPVSATRRSSQSALLNQTSSPTRSGTYSISESSLLSPDLRGTSTDWGSRRVSSDRNRTPTPE